MPEIQGAGHVALTVTDVKQAAEFYGRLFDAEIIMSGEDAAGPLTICASPVIMFGFRTHSGTRKDDRFDPSRVGLDHVGFHVTSREELDGWQQRLDEQGIVNSGIQQDQFGWHLNAKDPDNIALEFFCAAPQD
jgi:glyoxylase I family protein